MKHKRDFALVLAPGQAEELAREGVEVVGVPPATDGGAMTVIALRADAKARFVAGSTATRRCIFCTELVSLAPSSERAAAGGAMIVCVPCAPRLESGGEA